MIRLNIMFRIKVFNRYLVLILIHIAYHNSTVSRKIPGKTPPAISFNQLDKQK